MALKELSLFPSVTGSIRAVRQNATCIRAVPLDFFTGNRQHLEKWLNQMWILMVTDRVFIGERALFMITYM